MRSLGTGGCKWQMEQARVEVGTGAEGDREEQVGGIGSRVGLESGRLVC